MKETTRPSWVVAAWPGLGSVGLGAATFLVSQLKAKEIDAISGTIALESPGVAVEKGLLLPVEAPRSYIHEWQGPEGRDLYVVTADSQPVFRSFAYGNSLLERLPSTVERVITFAAAPRSLRPNETPRVWAAASQPELLEELEGLGVQLLDQGQISGMNGLFPGIAAMRGIEAICLLGELPYETVGIPNPKSSLAVLEIFSKMFDLTIDLEPLEEMATEWEERVSSADRGEGEDFGGDFPEELLEVGEVPEDVLANIERLFSEAKRTRERANDLKTELDRWKLFGKYEDRFLDLFKTDDS